MKDFLRKFLPGSSSVPQDFDLSHSWEMHDSGTTEGENSRYVVEDKVLSPGGMSHVHKGWDKKRGRLVAVKGSKEQSAEEYKFLELEAKTLSSLSHPGLPEVYDFTWVNNVPFIIMEFINAPNLWERLNQDPLPTTRDISTIVSDLADIMEFLAKRSILHRDINPLNIFCAQPHTILGDFGSTTKTTYYRTLSDFSAPEIRVTEDLDIRSDIYSLAAVAHYSLFAEIPDPYASLDTVRHPDPALAPLSREQRGALQPVFAKALNKDMKQRYSRPTDFSNSFRKSLFS